MEGTGGGDDDAAAISVTTESGLVGIAVASVVLVAATGLAVHWYRRSKQVTIVSEFATEDPQFAPRSAWQGDFMPGDWPVELPPASPAFAEPTEL